MIRNIKLKKNNLFSDSKEKGNIRPGHRRSTTTTNDLTTAPSIEKNHYGAFPEEKSGQLQTLRETLKANYAKNKSHKTDKNLLIIPKEPTNSIENIHIKVHPNPKPRKSQKSTITEIPDIRLKRDSSLNNLNSKYVNLRKEKNKS